MIPLAERRIKAVLFDIGETLLDFGPVNTSKLFRRGARLSYEFLKSTGQPVGGYNLYCWKNLILLRLRHLFSNITKRDFDSFELLRKIGIRAGYKLDENQWRHLAWLWYEPLSELATVEAGITETLDALKRAGLKLGIVSNTFINAGSLEKHLEKFGLLRFFSVRLYSYQFGFRKPDIRIFKAAAERLGEPFKNIMFVGDRIDKDAKPAIKAGMLPVLKRAYTNIGKIVPKGIWKIERLCELPELINTINGQNVSAEPSYEAASIKTYTRSD